EAVALERTEVVGVAQLLPDLLEERPVARARRCGDFSLEALAQVGAEPIVVEQGVVDVQQEHHRPGPEIAHARPEPFSAGFSWCPPNSNRIAESTRPAKSALPRWLKRSSRAVLSTGTGTPSSMAAATVQRPSPESETRPEKPSSAGLLVKALAVRSSSHEATTLPRRHTSATSRSSNSYR